MTHFDQPELTFDADFVITAEPPAAAEPEPPMPREAARPLTLADALAQIRGWSHLSDRTRADLTSAVRTAARIIGRAPAEILACPAHLSAALTAPAATFGLERSAKQALMSRLRRVLRTMGLHAPRAVGTIGLSKDWVAFLDPVPIKAERASLLALGRWASTAGIAPAGMSDEALARFCAEEAATRLSGHAEERARTLARAWRHAVAAQPEGVALPLLRAPKRRTPYVLTREQLPPSFVEELDAYAAALGGTSDKPFTMPGRGRALRPATVALRVFALRQAASALVHSSVPIEALRGLRDLVEPIDRAETALEFFFERAGGRYGGQLWNVAETLRQLGRSHLTLPEPSVLRLRELAREAAGPPKRGLGPRVRAKLLALTAPGARGLLLTLPADLMKRAASPDLTAKEAARLARNAAMLEILIMAPVRLRNLRHLELGRSFVRIGQGREVRWCIMVEGEETKTGEPIQLPLSPTSSMLLQRYIDHYRPEQVSGHGTRPWLFPGRGGKPMSAPGIQAALQKLVANEVGVHFHPHLARHFAAWNFLKAVPGAYVQVQRLLGHRNLQTTVAHYCGLEADASAEALQRAITEQRTASALEAKAARARRKKNPPQR